MENEAVRKVISLLMYRGSTDEEIAQIISGIGEEAFEQFAKEAMSLFSEDDLRAIDECSTQTEADDKIKSLYSTYAGKDAQEYIDSLVTQHAQEYLNEQSSEEPQL